jgi:hypothetical protein
MGHQIQDLSHLDRNDLLIEMENVYHSFSRELYRRFKNKVVILTNPTLKGFERVAVIEEIVIRNGNPYFLCMVVLYGTDPSKKLYLNTPSWSREYRPIREFRVMTDEEIKASIRK